MISFSVALIVNSWKALPIQTRGAGTAFRVIWRVLPGDAHITATFTNLRVSGQRRRLADGMMAAPTVVLVHGLGRTRRSMLPLAREGARRGFHVVNHGYRSTRASIDDHATRLAGVVRALGDGGGTIHFVTHSLGGIVLRAMLAAETGRPARLGRVVMISPPNRGSELVDVLGRYRLYQMAMGRAGGELGTTPDSTPNRLGPATFELGIITGDRSLNPLFSRLVEGPSDGKVSVDRARLEGMRDFLVVRRSHSFIMRAPEVIEAVFRFIESGSFRA